VDAASEGRCCAMPSSVRSLKRPYDPVVSSTAPQVLLQSSDCRGDGIRVMAQRGP
jgi:hypothetical protein